MDRRNFLKAGVAAGGTVLLGDAARAAEAIEGALEGSEAEGKLIASAPMLQNFAEDSIGIAFAVGALANGYVLIGRKKDLSDAIKFWCGGYRLRDISDKVIQVRVTGLKPATTYYYRIGADRISYEGGYKMKILGNEEDPAVYSFRTAGEGTRGSFCVINDTHAKWEAFGKVQDKLSVLAPACVIWNGDASNCEEKIENQMRIFLTPPIARTDYAASTPYLFCPGNHDSRGMANRHLENVWMYRQPEERSPRDWDLGRNFAVRLGKVALIGLDTAEDKMDTNPLFANLFASEPYRKAQTEWLRDALRRKEIAEAPFLVAFCHIPLFDDDPTHNPGDIAPADKDPQYSSDFAYWQRTCASMWGPLLHEAGCQLLVCGHMHRYRYDPATQDRCWAQIVGGGPKMNDQVFPTVIEGKVSGHHLQVTVHNLFTGEVQERFKFSEKKFGNEDEK